MSMRSKILSLAAIAAIAAVIAAVVMIEPSHVSAEDNAVAAVVNGDKIMKKDVLGALKTLPIKSDQDEKVYPMVVNQMVNDKLITEATDAAKLETTAEYKSRLKVMESQLAKQMFIQDYLKGKVTDSEVQAAYDTLKAKNEGKEEIHARHIIVSTKAEAEDIIKQLNKGADFENLAKKRSSGPTAARGGDLGYFAKDDMLPAFSDAAFKLKVGTYTKTPVHTKFGWHVIEVVDKRKRVVPPLKDVDKAIRNRLSQQALGQMVSNLREKAHIQEYDFNGKPIKADAPQKD